MSLKSSYKLQGYLVRQIEEMFEEDAIEPANRLTAKIGARMARGNFRPGLTFLSMADPPQVLEKTHRERQCQ